jgi:TRAP transporter TAXI family solute receptor
MRWCYRRILHCLCWGSRVTRIRIGLLLVLAFVALTGCTRGPGQAELQRDVQAQLDTLFGSRVLEVKWLKRQGSAPFANASDGGSQAIVYFNAVLVFTAPYDPSDWSGLSPELIASALGATDEGLLGLGSGAVSAGSELRAYGSTVYHRAGGSWHASLLPSSAAKSESGTGHVKSSELIERLATVVNTTPGLQDADNAIVAEELDQALQDIRLRLNRGDQNVVVATGPSGGGYARFVASLQSPSADWSVTQANTHGSVENALMIDSGEARFALVQSDVAAAAVTGQGAFAAHGPLRHLRGIAALFPEPVHVVVRADSGITSVEGLRGARIAVGSVGSGTGWTAIQVLRAHGLEYDDYVSVDAASPEEALQLLLTDRTDAVIEVISAPWQQFVSVAAQSPLKLLPLDLDAMQRLSEYVPGLVPLTILPRTYAGQDSDVPTLAATALLVARTTESDVMVQQVLRFLFADESAAHRGVRASRLSRERARSGITMPLHDGAAAYFSATQVPVGNIDLPAPAKGY